MYIFRDLNDLMERLRTEQERVAMRRDVKETSKKEQAAQNARIAGIEFALDCLGDYQKVREECIDA